MEATETSPFFARPSVLLRTESGVAFALVLGLYAHFFPGHWLFFALLFLFPDIALVAFVGGPTRGASAFYNLLHTSTLPLLTEAYAWSVHSDLGMRFGLVWFAHIAFDRILGFGLKYPGNFRLTHLQTVATDAFTAR